MSESFWAVALFDYNRVEDTELTIRKGDRVFIDEQNDSGWCLARLNDQSGWVPTDYVERCDPPEGQDLQAQYLEPEPEPAYIAPEPEPLPIPQPVPLAPEPVFVPEPVPLAPAPTPVAPRVEQEISSAMKNLNVQPAGDGKSCFGCRRPVDSAFVVAQDKTFHADCFKCKTCHVGLAGKAFIEKDGAHFCENCYYTTFNPKCAHCDETIKGQYISALNKSWHPDHFVCTECGDPFEGNQFHKHDDKPYCERHFNELFAESCGKCGKKIEGQVFEALDRKYHLDCFTCTLGDHKIGEGVNFHLHNEKIYCPEHFEELFLQRCAGCSQIIKGQYVKVLDSHYHPTCWKCTDCSTIISSDNCGQSGGKFYCRPCVAKRGGASGPSPGAASIKARQDVKASTSGGGGGGGGGGYSASSSSSAAPVAAASSASSASSSAAADAPSAPNPNRPGAKFVEYSTLVNMTGDQCRAEGVDPATKEDWMAPADFAKVFGMDRASFDKLPTWKKLRIKKNVRLM